VGAAAAATTAGPALSRATATTAEPAAATAAAAPSAVRSAGPANSRSSGRAVCVAVAEGAARGLRPASTATRRREGTGAGDADAPSTRSAGEVTGTTAAAAGYDHAVGERVTTDPDVAGTTAAATAAIRSTAVATDRASVEAPSATRHARATIWIWRFYTLPTHEDRHSGARDDCHRRDGLAPQPTWIGDTAGTCPACSSEH
jgi:hypothetical protein